MMKNIKIPIVILSLVFLSGLLAGTMALAAEAPKAGDRLTVAGMLQNPQGKGVKEVEVEVLVNGQHVKTMKDEDIATGKSGAFVGELRATGRNPAGCQGRGQGLQTLLGTVDTHCRAGGGGWC